MIHGRIYITPNIGGNETKKNTQIIGCRSHKIKKK
jgi:hypothetical protein